MKTLELNRWEKDWIEAGLEQERALFDEEDFATKKQAETYLSKVKKLEKKMNNKVLDLDLWEKKFIKKNINREYEIHNNNNFPNEKEADKYLFKVIILGEKFGIKNPLEE